MAAKRSRTKATRPKARVQGASKRARSEAAKKGWKTRERKVEAALKDVAAKWGRALEFYRDTGDYKPLKRVDAQRAKLVQQAEKTRRWNRVLRRIAKQAAETFDIEEDTFVR